MTTYNHVTVYGEVVPPLSPEMIEQEQRATIASAEKVIAQVHAEEQSFRASKAKMIANHEEEEDGWLEIEYYIEARDRKERLEEAMHELEQVKAEMQAKENPKK